MTTSHSTPEQVLFFGTCLLDALAPQAGLDAIALLEGEGTEVIYPQAQTCCGQPAFNAGYRDEARRVARAQLDCLQGDAPVVVPSASCADMFKHHYPELFAGEPEEEAALQLAARVWEFTQFLTDVLFFRPIDNGPPLRVALHDSCASRRGMHSDKCMEKLIMQLDEVELVHHERAAECCGFGGTFSIKQPDISLAMVEDKREALLDSGAERFISQDFGCLMNINGALEFSGAKLHGQHIASFLRERIGDGEKE